ncbi:MAG: methionine--tRNA ligase, partial [Gemmatimonadaceae bacterium]|nr:methionine--tRNA ligase [Gemmatimonadaceae bacterium]
LTTAIDYANGDPHLGHAFEKIGADVIARYHRMLGDKVWFLIGMDEHGQKVAQTAADRGLSPQELVDEVAETFQAMWRRLDISNDQFIRTTAPAHKAGVQALIERIFERSPSDFYEKSYEGYYCVGCESFKQGDEIVDGRCVLHPTRVLEWVEERNWFFRLSAYREFLLAHFDAHPEFLQPESRRNEILSLLRQGLDDVSASRARLAWGVSFPRPTSDGETQTTYVWFDALPNYLTSTGSPDTWDSSSRWPAQLHIIGKDITRFHAVIWPAMLKAAGLKLPEQIWAHGFVNLGGERFSKSAGVKLELGEAIDRFGADAFRYFLMREVPFDADGNFSWERFEERYTSDLANGFGNLASRTIAMIEKYRDGIVPAWTRTAADDDEIPFLESYHEAMLDHRLHEGLQAVFRSVAGANEYVDWQAPWKLARDPEKAAQLDEALATLARKLAIQTVLLAPFMPRKAQSVWEQLGGPGAVADQRISALALDALDPTGWRVTKGAPLFPRDAPAPA